MVAAASGACLSAPGADSACASVYRWELLNVDLVGPSRIATGGGLYPNAAHVGQPPVLGNICCLAIRFVLGDGHGHRFFFARCGNEFSIFECKRPALCVLPNYGRITNDIRYGCRVNTGMVNQAPAGTPGGAGGGKSKTDPICSDDRATGHQPGAQPSGARIARYPGTLSERRDRAIGGRAGVMGLPTA